MSGDDQSLQRAFDALKNEDAARSPEFASLMSRARVRERRLRRTRVTSVTLAAIAATMLFVTTRSVERPPAGALAAELIASEGRWRGPTDFLLDRGPEPLWQSTETLRETLTYTRKPQ